jgi:hypothetical protein
MLLSDPLVRSRAKRNWKQRSVCVQNVYDEECVDTFLRYVWYSPMVLPRHSDEISVLTTYRNCGFLRGAEQWCMESSAEDLYFWCQQACSSQDCS